jgi:hypothetical protein
MTSAQMRTRGVPGTPFFTVSERRRTYLTPRDAANPLLLTHWTPARIRASLSAVSVKEMKQWVHENLGTTLTSKRATAYKELAISSG